MIFENSANFRPVLTRLEKFEERREKLQAEIKAVGGLPGKV